MTPDEARALGARPGVAYCDECVTALRNGAEPGETACDARHDGEVPWGVLAEATVLVSEVPSR